ncbi:MAG: tyrosine-type recombinase/integrase [Clostridiales Family XIII bacterium]|jgi:integrase/recombinase XerD|nr:tyrosine-type recombinase/integrase [Clostridiales Family XIII bacterium]
MIEEFIKAKKSKYANNSILAMRRDLNGFRKYLETKNISIINAPKLLISSFLLALKDEKKSDATIKRQLSTLKKFYKFQLKNGKIEEDPTKNIKVPKTKRYGLDFLTVQEIEVLFTEIYKKENKRDIAIIELLYGTGIRVSEIIDIKISDLDLEKTSNIIISSNKKRLIPLNKKSFEALISYIESEERKVLESKNMSKGILFLNHSGKKLSRQSVWKIIKKYANLAKISKKITPQILRDSFCLHILRNGADVFIVKEIMGFSDLMSLNIYLSLIKNRTKEVFNKCHPRN